MEISDIQIEENHVVLTFCSRESSQNIIELKITKEDAWQIADFCGEKLSYRAQLKANK